MGRGRKVLAIINILILTATLFACNDTEVNVEKTIQHLTSADLSGRFPGTEGNVLTQDYLVKTLFDLGIAPFNGDSYFQPYTRTVVDVESAELTADEEPFVYKDEFQFLYAPDAPFDLTLPLVLEGEGFAAPCIVLSSELLPRDLIAEPNVHAVILNRIHMDAQTVITPDKIQNTPVLTVEDAVYRRLLSHAGEEISLSAQCAKKELMDNNVVGSIYADNQTATEAIVLGAHFDHLGVSPTRDAYFQGALDNASGVAAVLEIAGQITASDTPQTRDIYVVFFNSEEYAIWINGGSRYFADWIEAKYEQVYCINIDCIGEKGAETTFLYRSERADSVGLADDLNSFLAAAGIPVSQDSNAGSDHSNFSAALTVTTGFAKANTLEDTTDLIDYQAIEGIAGHIADYILELAGGRAVATASMPAELASEDEAVVDWALQELLAQNQLAVGQCRVIPYEDKLYHVVREGYFWPNITEFYNQWGIDLGKLQDELGLNIIQVNAVGPSGTPRVTWQLPFAAGQVCPVTKLPGEAHEVGETYTTAVDAHFIKSLSIFSVGTSQYDDFIMDVERFDLSDESQHDAFLERTAHQIESVDGYTFSRDGWTLISYVAPLYESSNPGVYVYVYYQLDHAIYCIMWPIILGETTYAHTDEWEIWNGLNSLGTINVLEAIAMAWEEAL